MTTAPTHTNAQDTDRLAQKNGERWERAVKVECKALGMHACKACKGRFNRKLDACPGCGTTKFERAQAAVSKNFEADKVPGMQVRREPSKPDFSGHLISNLSAEGKKVLKEAAKLMRKREQEGDVDLLAIDAKDVMALHDHGRHVIFEAKATFNKTNFPLSKIAEHQWEALDCAHHDGAVAFVYVNEVHGDANAEGRLAHIEREREWVLPWSVILRVRNARSSWPFLASEAEFIPEHDAYAKRPRETWLDTWRRLERDGLI